MIDCIAGSGDEIRGSPARRELMIKLRMEASRTYTATEFTAKSPRRISFVSILSGFEHLGIDHISLFRYNNDIKLQGGRDMPTIRPSSDLRNKYSEISEFCHKYDEPVYITKNGQGDLAVMSIETYEKLVGKFELYKLLDEGLDAKQNQKVRPFREALADIVKGIPD